MVRARQLGWIAIVSYLVAVFACGARSELEIPSPRRSPVPEGGSGGGIQPPECVVYNSSAALAPLVVFLMLDSSGSMWGETGNGKTKWLAVQDALSEFFYDSESAGIEVSLHFFPYIDQTVSQFCFEDLQCQNVPDACTALSMCPNAGVTCTKNADCAAAGFPSDTCEPLGQCTGAATQVLCIPTAGLNCPPNQGPCESLGYCENRYKCDPEVFEFPQTPVEALPDAASQVLQTINGHYPEGQTPTLPALTGAVNRAGSWLEENPNSKVIVLLATDGFPTICDPDIEIDPAKANQNLADAAAVGDAMGVQTFVIGVFAPGEETLAAANLDAIAAAGGTNEAFVISSSGNVTSDFLEALNEVRVTAKSCEFALAATAEPFDYANVWVRIVPKVGSGEAEVWVPRVADPNACDPTTGGFYYDQPLGGSVSPSRLILCPASCDLLGASTNRTVEIFTTCDDPMG
jgi:hypothetical protein